MDMFFGPWVWKIDLFSFWVLKNKMYEDPEVFYVWFFQNNYLYLNLKNNFRGEIFF